ncbi:MAG: UPF0403 protein [Melioribacteraceae bacterium]|nr:MAG: UPF0403 protein [Melioribacteraceae bacterium]
MLNAKMRPPIYDPEAVQPMRDELLYVGFEEVVTPQLVEDRLSLEDDKISLVMINSVCGCAAGSARPGVTHAVMNEVIPDRLLTSFAGQDRDAVDHLRNEFLGGFPPSSPSMALIKNKEVVFMLPRHHIEGRTPQQIAEVLADQFNQHCTKKGPVISEEAYAKLVHARACGSKIPLNETKDSE